MMRKIFQTLILPGLALNAFVAAWTVTPPPPPPYLGMIATRTTRPDAYGLPKKWPSSISALRFAASLEEGEDLLLHYQSTPPLQGDDDDGNPRIPPPKVQRVYETWHWTYGKEEVSTTKAAATTTSKTYQINYRVEGKGPPILLVHGFGANLNHFRYQFPALVAAGYRVYAIDLLGFGASDKPLTASTTGFSIELFVQQLIDFMSAMQQKDQLPLQQRPWTLAGNSIGGLCCLGVAAQLETNPHWRSHFEISSVVLFNTSGGMTGFRYEYVPFWARPLMAFVRHVVLGPLLGGYFFQNFRTRDNVERILTESGVYGDPTAVDDELLEILLTPADDAGAAQVFLAVFAGPAGPTPEAYLRQVSVPVLALWGERDPWTPVDAGMHPGTGLSQHHRTGDFVLDIIAGAGHCPHDECPAVVNEKMIAFLQRVAAASSAASTAAIRTPTLSPSSTENADKGTDFT